MKNTLIALVISCVLLPRLEAQAQRKSPRSRSAKKPEPIPGLAHTPEKYWPALRRRFQKPLDDLAARRKDAYRQAVKWKAAAGKATGKEAARLKFMAARSYVNGNRVSSALPLAEATMKDAPDSVWAREARLLLFDLSVEHEGDWQTARDAIAPLDDWAAKVPLDQAKPRPAEKQPNTSGRPDSPLPFGMPGPDIQLPQEGDALKPRTDAAIGADALLRIGMLAWLNGDPLAARDRFKQALKLAPSHPDPLANFARQATGIKPVPERNPLLKSDDASVMHLVLYADVLMQSNAFRRALRMWNMLLKKHRRQLTKLQQSFLHYRRGFAVFRLPNPLEKNVKGMLTDYEASHKLAEDAPWANDALFMAGNVAWNLHRNVEAAAEYWSTVAADEKHRLAPQASYHMAAAYELDKQWQKSKDTLEEHKRRWPKSPYTKLVDEHLKKVNRRLPRSK